MDFVWEQIPPPSFLPSFFIPLKGKGGHEEGRGSRQEQRGVCCPPYCFHQRPAAHLFHSVFTESNCSHNSLLSVASQFIFSPSVALKKNQEELKNTLDGSSWWRAAMFTSGAACSSSLHIKMLMEVLRRSVDTAVPFIRAVTATHTQTASPALKVWPRRHVTGCWLSGRLGCSTSQLLYLGLIGAPRPQSCV